MPETAKCPYCNQPLGSSAAVRHLHQAEERFRRQLLAEATANVERKVADARASTEKKVRVELEREKSKRERGLTRTIETLQRQNDDLQRRLEGLSAPDRGDMNEADIAAELTHAFPDDEIKREGKGGDILQVVRYPCGGTLEEAGVILYECKDTKRWSNGFISQIKSDGRTHRTPYLLLISRALPAKEQGACVRDDVVIADPLHVAHLAWIVRRAVIETHRAELAGQDRAAKTARLYEYLRSAEFREQLSAVVRAGTQLTEMLQRERKEHERDWSRRKHTYDELLRNSVGIEEAIQHIVEFEGPAMSHKARSGRGRSRARQHDGRTPRGSPV